MDSSLTPIQARQYAEQTDLPRLSAFLMEVNDIFPSLSNWQVGDLIWRLFLNTVFEPSKSIRLWEDRDGRLLGFACFESPDTLRTQIHPTLGEREQVQQAMVDWGLEQAQAAQASETVMLQTTASESDEAFAALLLRNGFVRSNDHYVHWQQPLDDAALVGPQLPEGWQVRHVGDESEWQARVDLHREVWQSSKVTLEAYRRLRQAPFYRPDLDLVAVAPDGTLASYCIIWLDTHNRSGEFEPVGTRPAYRRQGIGKALLREGLRRLRTLGAEIALVLSWSGSEPAGRLYASAGFQVCGREWVYELRQ